MKAFLIILEICHHLLEGIRDLCKVGRAMLIKDTFAYQVLIKEKSLIVQIIMSKGEA